MNSVKRSSVLWMVAMAVAAAAAIRAVDLSWRRMESSETGRARWIWATDDLRAERPIGFRASKTIVVGQPVGEARAKIFVDRSYRLLVDGVVAGSGGQRPGDPLDVIDLTGRLAPGPHEIAVEAGSPTGVGGILFSLDLAGAGRNAIVSDGSWTVGGRPVFVWGDPPMYPWGFPALPKPRR